jgi:hypothetical protein
MLTCIQKRILSTTTMQFLQTALHHADSHAAMHPTDSQDPANSDGSHWYLCIPLISLRPTDTYGSHRKPCIPQTVMRPIDSYASQKWQPCIPQTAMHPTDSHASHRQPCISQTAMHLRDSHASHRQPMNPTDSQTSQKTESQDPTNSDGSRIKLGTLW